MAGNVWECVADWYDSDYYGRSPSQNPQGPDSGKSKVKRGGSWVSRESDARAAFRDYFNLASYSDNVRFRCARSPE